MSRPAFLAGPSAVACLTAAALLPGAAAFLVLQLGLGTDDPDGPDYARGLGWRQRVAAAQLAAVAAATAAAGLAAWAAGARPTRRPADWLSTRAGWVAVSLFLVGAAAGVGRESALELVGHGVGDIHAAARLANDPATPGELRAEWRESVRLTTAYVRRVDALGFVLWAASDAALPAAALLALVWAAAVVVRAIGPRRPGAGAAR